MSRKSDKHEITFISIPHEPGLSQKVRRVGKKCCIRTVFKTHWVLTIVYTV